MDSGEMNRRILIAIRNFSLWTTGTGLALSWASLLHAAVTLDGSVGRAGALPGPNYQITADLGRQVGGNLFHSFGQFSINTGESATFSGSNSVSNIIGRVTGGQMSFIDGAIRSTIPGANLYLLNPTGMLFGEHATLDVSGSFHVSTADYLRLSDGGRFDARIPDNSVLTVAPIAAFGFLSDAPGKIEVNGSFLRVSEGQTLSLVGGDLNLTNATLYAPAGRINLAAVGSAGEVIPTDTGLSMQGFGRLGVILVDHSSTQRVVVDLGDPPGETKLGDVDASGQSGGGIFIRGGQWVSRGGWVFANTYGDPKGQGVDVVLSGAAQLEDEAQLIVDTLGAGDAGSVTLHVGRLELSGGSQIAANTFGSGDGGGITITTRDAVIISGTGSTEDVLSGLYALSSIGDAGSITLNAVSYTHLDVYKRQL